MDYRSFLLAPFLFALHGNVASQPAGSMAQKVAVIELFTSEGCSSCPPADTLLTQINGTVAPSGQLILGISEHVTYWNSLGWKDPFSKDTFTVRQEQYAARLSNGEPYTPQMVINGREQFVGSDTYALQQALRRDAERPRLKMSVEEMHAAPGQVDLQLGLKGLKTKQSVDIIAVVVDDEDRSSVMRGENAGRSLTHISVARLMAKVATVSSDGPLHVSFPISSTLSVSHETGHHVVVLAQVVHQREILAAVTVPIALR